MLPFIRGRGSRARPRGIAAILVPTHRFDSRARSTLAAVAALASNDVAVCIGDNSENPEKWRFLRSLAKIGPNIHIFCHRRNIGAFRNWRFLADRAGLQSLMFVGDDDSVTPQYIDGSLQMLEAHSDVAAAAGAFIMMTSANQLVLGNGARTEGSAADRCINFRIGGGNSIPNSMIRRAALRSYLEYLDVHPLKASFFDWLMSYAVLAHGKYRTTDKGCYLYDLSNWENAAACWTSNSRFYVAAGLGEPFVWFHELYWAVESAHYFRGRYSPIGEAEMRAASARAIYLDRINAFRGMWSHPANAVAYEQLLAGKSGARDAVELLVRNDDGLHPELFSWFGQLLGAFDQTCARAYREFVASSIESAPIPS